MIFPRLNRRIKIYQIYQIIFSISNVKYTKKNGGVCLTETENLYLNNCVKIKSLADEYLHDDPELSAADRDAIENHLKMCDGCAAFYDGEKYYLDGIKAAEYIPAASVSEAVMNTIIENTLTVDRGTKKRFVPFGVISAAAVVLIIFGLSRTGLFDLYNNINTNTADNSRNSNSNIGGSDNISPRIAENNRGFGELRQGLDESDLYVYDGGEAGANAGEVEYAEDSAADIDIDIDIYNIYNDVNAIPDIDLYDGSDSDADYEYIMPAATEAAAKAMGAETEIPQIMQIEVCQTVWTIADEPGNIFEGIEIVETRDNGRLFIIHSKDKDALIYNLKNENVLYQFNNENGGDPEYIAVRLNLAYPTEE